MDSIKEIYFLGSMTQNGFVTHFSKDVEDSEFTTYILKGGAGCGKSSLMKKVAKAFEGDDDIAYFYCSSDPLSLDAIKLKKHKAIVLDGTSPHVFDPVYPGVCQKIINLGQCWDEDKLKENRDEIILTTDENKKLHQRARRYITAISHLNGDIAKISEDMILKEKLEAFIKRFAKKNFKRCGDKEGDIFYRQLSALTNEGYKTQFDTIKGCERIFSLTDDMFSGSDRFIKGLSQTLASWGIDCIISPCALVNGGNYEHMLVPQYKTAFVTNSFLNKLRPRYNDTGIINFMRFYDKNTFLQKRQRINFSKKAVSELVDETHSTLIKAKSVHDDIERYYIDAMDFDKVNAIADKIINEIENA